MALQHLLGFTCKSDENADVFHYLTRNEEASRKFIKILKTLCLDNMQVVHDAVKALINLSNDIVCAELIIDDEFIMMLVKFVMHPKFLLADLVCMLLCNLSKSQKCNKILLKNIAGLDQLVEAFCRSTLHNERGACLDFLAPLFANVALLSEGRQFFLTRHRKASDAAAAEPEYETPLKKLAYFTEHPSTIRRGGVICTVKNCSMDIGRHQEMFKCEDFLVRTLLPLAGPEELSEADMDGLPDALQFLEETKLRESDPELRKNLLEILLLWASTKAGRDYMRMRKVYPIVREMHLNETDKQCDTAAHELVQMLMRDETQQQPISELDSNGNEIIDELVELESIVNEKSKEMQELLDGFDFQPIL